MLTQTHASLRRLFALGSLAALTLLAPRLHAWNGTGHMTVASIAYDNLTPKARAGVDALLARHRDYGLWMSQLPPGYTDRGRFAFMKAATWPDDIRKTPDDRPIWHYIDVPVIAAGYTPDPAALLIVRPNAETQIGEETALLTRPGATDGERAVALCWVEHLIGDIHQPLHDASLFSPLFPKGDKGGNDENLAPNAVDGDPREAAAHPHRLHALWDDLLGAATDPVEVQKIASGLQTPAFGRRAFPQIAAHRSVHEWVLEGRALAQQSVYLDGKLPLTPTGGGKADLTLPPGYLDAAHKIGDSQVALAGLRLADTLNAQVFPAPSSGLAPSPVPGLLAVPMPPAAPAPPIVPVPVVDGAASGQIIGNKRTHVYHLAGDGRLPSERNRVYFPSEEAAIAAGYRRAGAGTPAAGH